MNLSKVSYWNALRKLVTKIVVVLWVIEVSVLIALLGFQKFTSYFLDPLQLNVILVMLIDLVLYIMIINVLLLFFEFLDITLKFKTIPILKKLFKVIVIILAVAPMLVYLAFLILADPKYIHLVA
ncbi:hypothetical protein FJ651_14765 [Paucihalobacter ruber]|uniref:Uncharacterized protein n=1 Tax=Paucihalobacter ruber TaxID=2567861 RepID=A0A506PEI6_9FLAO|nr:hypothetical protein [Paucihalobacter ruber]TPV31452.1 hypothetical protein FJ651_14765 [Paucihalobacter ruber]